MPHIPVSDKWTTADLPRWQVNAGARPNASACPIATWMQNPPPWCAHPPKRQAQPVTMPVPSINRPNGPAHSVRVIPYHTCNSIFFSCNEFRDCRTRRTLARIRLVRLPSPTELDRDIKPTSKLPIGSSNINATAAAMHAHFTRQANNVTDVIRQLSPAAVQSLREELAAQMDSPLS
jgi:hypothetical protein